MTISAGAGDDSISNRGIFYYNYGENVLFKYSGGNDTIDGFNETSTLQIASGKLNSVITTNGKDYFVGVGKSKIILQGAASLESVNILNSKGKKATYKIDTRIIVTSGNDYLTNYVKAANISVGAGDDTISNYGEKVTINAGTGDDTISNSGANVSINAGAGDDYVYNRGATVKILGGAGNDSLYGDEGDDTFIYKPGEGTDTIFDYEAGDMLQILKANGKSGGTFSSSLFEGGTLTLAIDGGGSVIFDDVSAGDKINVNGTVHTISGNKLK